MLHEELLTKCKVPTYSVYTLIMILIMLISVKV
jgi:hypothetical protein